MNKRLTLVDILIIVVSLSVFAFIKIAGPLLIEQLYVNQQIDLFRMVDWKTLKTTLRTWECTKSDVAGCWCLRMPRLAEPVTGAEGFNGAKISFLSLLV